MKLYDVVADFGAVGDGNPANAAINTLAFQKAIAAGNAYVPPGKFVVNNGQIKITTPNVVFRGEGSMGSSSDYNAPTSLIMGQGPGHTLSVTGPGCTIKNLVFKSSGQSGGDACILVTGTQCTLSDMCFDSPNIGISLQLPADALGEFWIKDVLMGDIIRVAGISANAGCATVHLNHVIMCNFGGPQPPYGVVITSAGEFIMNNGCDIIGMGTCLAIVPGLDGTKNQYVNAVTISDSYFDSGNGLGCVYICPKNAGYVSIVRMSNVWTSTDNNNSGHNPTNGFTFDGTQSIPALGNPAIQDISMVNCTGRSFVGHCGLYAKGVQGLGIFNSTFAGNFDGIHIAAGCSGVILIGNKCGNYTPSPVGFPPINTAYGIVIEPTNTNEPFTVAMNMCYGNGKMGLFNNNPPRPYQIVALNQG